MTTVFVAMPYSRFIEIQINLSRKKHHRTNQRSNLETLLATGDSVKAPIQFRREKQPQHVRGFSHPFPSIFTSVASVLLDRSNETS